MSLSEETWQSLKFTNKDIESLYNHLLEIETPQTISQLIESLINKVIETDKKKSEQARKSEGVPYFPKESYSVGQSIVFPHRNYQSGKVVDVRPGINPEYPDLEVVTVEFSPEETVSFASKLADHALNHFTPREDTDLSYNPEWVITHFGKSLSEKLLKLIQENDDLISIAGSFFPRSLLIDINVGFLNLAEAVLEMAEGGPLSTSELIKQIELPVDSNAKLIEFSMNYALQEDHRFDEVGPAGVTLWFLNRLEPEEVRNIPFTLKFAGKPEVLPDEVKDNFNFGETFCDELEPDKPDNQGEPVDEVAISLTYPHWRAGTLPLTSKLQRLFPTAYETPRVKFTFKEGNSGNLFNGWVVRPTHYIYGLKDWYTEQGFMPGSEVYITRSSQPGEVIVRAEKKHNSKDWIRTFLVGADGNYVFALLKQVVNCSFDDRMAIVIPDVAAVDAIWEKYEKTKPSLEKIVLIMMRELTKLNPQGHVHAQELYAAVNVVKRCPPSLIVDILFNRPWAVHMGDLYFRLDETQVPS